MRTLRKTPSIRESRLFQAAIQLYNDAMAAFEALPGSAETEQPERYQSLQAAYLEAGEALAAVIDQWTAHCIAEAVSDLWGRAA